MRPIHCSTISFTSFSPGRRRIERRTIVRLVRRRPVSGRRGAFFEHANCAPPRGVEWDGSSAFDARSLRRTGSCCENCRLTTFVSQRDRVPRLNRSSTDAPDQPPLLSPLGFLLTPASWGCQDWFRQGRMPTWRTLERRLPRNRGGLRMDRPALIRQRPWPAVPIGTIGEF